MLATGVSVLPAPERSAVASVPGFGASVLTGLVPWPDPLTDAVWHVDAGHLTDDGDGLKDLTGNGRDAMFGETATTQPVDDPIGGIEPDPDQPTTQPVDEPAAASARPVVLPWDGEDYLHIPAAGQGARITTTGALPYTATRRDGSTVTGTTPAGEWLFDTPGDWADLRTDDGAYILDPAYAAADYATIANTGLAGGDWTVTRAASGFKTAVVDRPLLLFGGGQKATAAAPRTIDGDMTALIALRSGPHKVGDSSSLLRASTDGTTTSLLIAGDGGHALRYWGTSHGYGVGSSTSPTAHAMTLAVRMSGETNEWGSVGEFWRPNTGSRVRPGLVEGQPIWIGGRGDALTQYYGEMEFVAAAIFDRALTDAEVELATLSLLGTPRAEDRRQAGAAVVPVGGYGASVQERREYGALVVDAPEVGPNQTWTRDHLVAWLAAHGVSMGPAALAQLTDAELLSLALDLLDAERP